TISRGGFELNGTASGNELIWNFLNMLANPVVGINGDAVPPPPLWRRASRVNIGEGESSGNDFPLGIKVGNLGGYGSRIAESAGNSFAMHIHLQGIWCRVCEGCYCGREGYRDFAGVSRHKTSSYLKHRKGLVDQVNLEANRIMKRLEKLSVLYAEESANSNKRSSISTISSLATVGKRQIDQSVVAWEEDSLVPKCPFCNNSFNSLTNRRHHCRLCGRVVCGTDTCSSNIPLPPPIPSSTSAVSPEPRVVRNGTASEADITAPSPGDIKTCKNCKSLVRRRQEAAAGEGAPPVVVKLYQSICKNKVAVDDLVPKFNNMILALKNSEEIKAEDREYVMASRYRKTLLDHFSEIEKLAKRIKSLPTSTPSLRKLQDNIHISTIQYLQKQHVHPPHDARTTREMLHHESGKPLSADEARRLDAAKTALAAMETQEEQLRAFIEDATRRRKLEDVAMLKESLGEVVMEVDRLKREVDGLLSGGMSPS
ncbi:FYVE zinc finger-domain-containing protein, partial [Chytridium lagenaria]